jgi:hypothetical protein
MDVYAARYDAWGFRGEMTMARLGCGCGRCGRLERLFSLGQAQLPILDIESEAPDRSHPSFFMADLTPTVALLRSSTLILQGAEAASSVQPA